MNTFADRLQELMKNNNINSTKLSEIINISQSAVSKYTTGKSLPNSSILGNIAKVFNVSTDFLVFGHEEYANEIEKALIETFRQLNHDNRYLVIKEANGLLAIQNLDNKKD